MGLIISQHQPVQFLPTFPTFLEESVGLWVTFTCTVLIVSISPIGVFCNLLAATALRQAALISPFNFLLMGLALSDMVICFSEFLIHVAVLCALLKTGESYGRLYCNYGEFYLMCLTLAGRIASFSFTAAATIERLIAVFFPLKAASILTYKRTWRVSCGIVFILITYEMVKVGLDKWVKVLNQIGPTYESYRCVYNTSFHSTDQWTWLVVFNFPIDFVNIVIPWVIIVVGNGLLVGKMSWNNWNHGELRRHGGSKKTCSTKTLLLISLFITICQLGRVMRYFTDSEFVDVNMLSNFLLTLNPAINFGLYGVYDKVFRRSFIRLISFNRAKTFPPVVSGNEVCDTTL